MSCFIVRVLPSASAGAFAATTIKPGHLGVVVAKGTTHHLVCTLGSITAYEWIAVSMLEVLEELASPALETVRERARIQRTFLVRGDSHLQLASNRVWRDDLITRRAAREFAEAHDYRKPVMILGAPAPHFCIALLEVARERGTTVSVVWVGSTFTKAHRAQEPLASLLREPEWHEEFVDAPVWRSFSPFTAQVNKVTSLRPGSVLISMARASAQDIAMFSLWVASLTVDTWLAFAGSPWGSTAPSIDGDLRLLRSAPNGPFRDSLPWASSLQWRGRVSASLGPIPPPAVLLPSPPVHICPALPSPRSELMYRGHELATGSVALALARAGITNIAAESQNFIASMSGTSGHSPCPSGLVDPLPAGVPDWISAHLSNWREALNHAIPGDALIIGEMTGSSSRALGMEFRRSGHVLSLEVMDAGDSFLGRSGASKLAYLAHNFPEIDVFHIGMSSVLLPALANIMYDQGRHFTIIYHDASHTADDTMIDLEHCFRMLPVGGLLIVDDVQYHGCTGDGPQATAVYAGRRGYLLFLELHRGDLREVEVPHPGGTQGFWIKVRDTVGLLGSPANPVQEPRATQLWCGTHDGRDQRPPLQLQWRNPTMYDGETYWDAVEDHSLALAALQALPRAGGAIIGGGFDIGRQALVNIGNGMSHLGAWIGSGHERDAVAGLGNAVKSGGHAMEYVSKGLGVAANWLFGRK